MEEMPGIVAYMKRNRLLAVTAESCTAGLIASKHAETPGAGGVLECAYVVYLHSPEVKQRCLGVRRETIDEFNLTSEAVAREMALGALSRSDANVAVPNTGVTGSTDPSIPAGTQCFAWVFKRGDGTQAVHGATRRFDGDRNQIREAAADFALRQIPQLRGD